jgi:DNA-binding SARP family transcriptional activator
MPFTAKSAAPHAVHTTLRHPACEQAAEGGITVFAAPRGYLLADGLAAALAERKRPMLWLRLGPEDGDPATFLVSLIGAARQLRPGIGADTLDHMRRRPGPTAGWPALFAHLAQELAETLPPNSALVFEHSHHLNDTHPTLGLIGAHLLPALPESIAGILTADHRLPAAALPASAVCVGASELSLDPSAALELAGHADSDLSSACVRRMVVLTDGRAVALAGLCAASAALGPALIQQAAERAGGADDLLARVARALLMLAGAEEQQALALALHLEYSHPALIEAALGHTAPPDGPWLQPLSGNWARVRAIWRAPLRAALRAGATPGSAALRRAADYLAGQGAVERAVPLYLELGECDAAANALTAAADTLMNLGQWEMLGEWLAQLPTPTLQAWPWLVYVGGEIAAARGDTNDARRAFAVSAELFSAHDDAEGACQSILAESALAAWQGDHAYARARALAASTAAEAASLSWHQGWAAWQLGCLAATCDIDDALAYFGRAAAVASTLDDSFMGGLLCQAEDLLLRQRELRLQRELHRQAYFAAERAEHEAGERLRRLISAPPEQIDSLLIACGWAHTPLMLKLPAPTLYEDMTLLAERAVGAPNLDAPARAGVWDRLLHAVGLRRHTVDAPAAVLAGEHVAILDGLPAYATLPPLLEAPLSATLTAGPGALPALGAPEQAGQPDIAPALTAYLLGPLRVTLADCTVESWPSSRGRAIFKYLLTHRDQPTPRDVLMDLFWPDAAPEAARNNLNVAIHGLRQALKVVSDVQVVIFQEGAYRLSSDLAIWLDVEEFERHVAAGRRDEGAGQLAAATAEYEVATGLYQGDFLADDPYEEWPVLARERLRVAYLDTLDRLAQLYFSQGKYAACATLCQQMLAQDSCREDAHCRLMRCYSRQGQHHLALRQYQACVEALHTDLDVEPGPATVQLYERIRRRERV